VAGPGEDETVVVIRQDEQILAIEPFAQPDARGPVLAALRPWLHHGLAQVNVDTAGQGWYFALALREGLPESVRVNEVNVGERPTDDRAAEKYANLKAELYWSLRDRFRDGQISGLSDQTTVAQLAGLRYEHDSRGRVKIESKEDARKRGAKSPDRAEALMLAFSPTSTRQALAEAMNQPMNYAGGLPVAKRPVRGSARGGWRR
jgi:phage terminase large subunit